MDSPTLDNFKIELDTVPGHLVWTMIFPREIRPDDP